MNHACGHAGYHVLDSASNDREARRIYDRMGAEPCPNCQKKPGFIVKDGMWVPNKWLEKVGSSAEYMETQANQAQRKEAARRLVRRALVRRTR